VTGQSRRRKRRLGCGSRPSSGGLAGHNRTVTRSPELPGEHPAGEGTGTPGERRRPDQDTESGRTALGPEQVSGTEQAGWGEARPDRSGHAERPDWLAGRLARLAASLPSAPGYLSEPGRAGHDSESGERLAGRPGRPAASDSAAADLDDPEQNLPVGDGAGDAGGGGLPWEGLVAGADGRVAGPGDGGRPWLAERGAAGSAEGDRPWLADHGVAGPGDGGRSWLADPGAAGLAEGDSPWLADRGVAGPGEVDRPWLADGGVTGSAERDRSGPAEGDRSGDAGQADSAVPGAADASAGPAGSGPDGGSGRGDPGGAGESGLLAGRSRRPAGDSYLPWFMSGQGPQPWFSEDPGELPG
jgi:hypothetical protein